MIPIPRTICLTAVVRNSANLGRFLDAVRPFIDAWIVVDTTEDARIGDLVADSLGASPGELPGRLLRESWAGYDVHRASAFAAARELADFGLILDPDEMPVADSGALPSRPGDKAYRVEITRGEGSYAPVRLLDLTCGPVFRGPDRECLVTDDSSVSPALFPQLRAVFDPGGDQLAGRYRRDALQIESVLQDDPGNARLRRALGDLYTAMGDWELARRCFEENARCARSRDERWYACYWLGRARDALGMELQDVVSAYHAAYEAWPDKAEPLYRIAVANRRALNTGIARDIADQARTMPFCDAGGYFERPVYDYLLDLEFSRSAYESGRHDAAIPVLEGLTRATGLPAGHAAWAGRLLQLARARREPLTTTSRSQPVPGRHSASVPEADAYAPTPLGRRRKMTIGMATYDDYDGVYFSATALRLYHPEVTEDTEIVVIDNNPGGGCSEALKSLDSWIPGYRYVPNGEVTGTAVRDLVFREANADYVLCMDSHVLIDRGAVRRLLDYLDHRPGCPDLLQGPLLLDNFDGVHTHFDPVWRSGMFGTWGSDPRGARPDHAPFEIPMQGLGLFACRREAWPGLNPRFRGFGGEEGYLHEKFRQRGGRTLCLPFLRWTHRFARPLGTRYPNVWEDRIRNYLIGFSELGLDTGPVRKHFDDVLDPQVSAHIFAKVEQEMAEPFFFFDAIYCINLDREKERWRQMTGRLRRLGILDRVRRFAAVPTPYNQHIGCALSHRRVIEQARRAGLDNVLVLEDDALFLNDTTSHLQENIKELMGRTWRLFYLGGEKWGQQLPRVRGCRHLEHATGVTCTHAIAYHRSMFDHLLGEIPPDYSGVKAWLEKHHGIDQYLATLDGAYITSPLVAVQPFQVDGDRVSKDAYPT